MGVFGAQEKTGYVFCVEEGIDCSIVIANWFINR
jgi:hypothetical protein